MSGQLPRLELIRLIHDFVGGSLSEEHLRLRLANLPSEDPATAELFALVRAYAWSYAQPCAREGAWSWFRRTTVFLSSPLELRPTTYRAAWPSLIPPIASLICLAIGVIVGVMFRAPLVGICAWLIAGVVVQLPPHVDFGAEFNEARSYHPFRTREQSREAFRAWPPDDFPPLEESACPKLSQRSRILTRILLTLLAPIATVSRLRLPTHTLWLATESR